VILARALQAQRRITSGDALKIASLVTVAVVVVAGAAESIFASEDFGSLWDGVWWAMTTITTVGYGDLYPKTTVGRLIGIVVMIVGIAVASVLTAAIASRFVRARERDDGDPGGAPPASSRRPGDQDETSLAAGSRTAFVA
jgi:voltage-gated potassium channel